MGKHSFREFVGIKYTAFWINAKFVTFKLSIPFPRTKYGHVNSTKKERKLFREFSVIFVLHITISVNFRAWGLMTTPTFLLFQSPFRDWYFKNLLWSGCDAQMAAYVYSMLFFLRSVLHVPVIYEIPGSWAESMQSRAVVWGSFINLTATASKSDRF